MLGNHYLSNSHFLRQLPVFDLVVSLISASPAYAKAHFYPLSQAAELSPLDHR